MSYVTLSAEARRYLHATCADAPEVLNPDRLSRVVTCTVRAYEDAQDRAADLAAEIFLARCQQEG